MSTQQNLRRSLGLFGAISLALGIVVGAGMLTLPGLVYRQAGGWAHWAWLLDAVIVLPLLFVFAVLGRRYPGAGGVAGFVGQAFPGLQVGCSYLLVGTFGLGIPAIALTGAAYAAGAVGLGDNRVALTALAAALLTTTLAAAWAGTRLAGALQHGLVALMIGGLAVITLFTLPHWPTVDFSAGNPSFTAVWHGAALAFFAYTGWEMLSFLSEEMRNPHRDFPLSVAVSLVLVVALYVGVSLAVQAMVPLDDPLMVTAPFLAIVQGVFGGLYAVPMVAGLATLIILANLNGAVWAASRLVYDTGRRGDAPEKWHLGHLSGAHGTPRYAIGAIAVVFALALAGFAVELWDLAAMLMLAGQNFFLLYAMCIVVFLKVAKALPSRLFAISALAVCAAFAPAFGWGLIYAGVLFALPYAGRGVSGAFRTKPRDVASR